MTSTKRLTYLKKRISYAIEVCDVGSMQDVKLILEEAMYMVELPDGHPAWRVLSEMIEECEANDG